MSTRLKKLISIATETKGRKVLTVLLTTALTLVGVGTVDPALLETVVTVAGQVALVLM